MYIARITGLGVFLACVGLVGEEVGPGKSSPQPTSAPGGHWILQAEYSDEFNETHLDLKKWDNDVKDWGVWSWEPGNAWIQDGNLCLRMQHHEHERDGKTLSYTSGILKSRATPIKYGYFEARIRAAPRYPGVCPAFWAYRQEKDLWTEIDFVELTERQQSVKIIDLNTHVFRHPRLANGKAIHEARSWRSPWDPREGFHVYGCEWSDQEIKWYIDGKLVKTRTNEYWHQALDVVLSFGVRSPLKDKPSGKGFPTIFQVDYVRVWKRPAVSETEEGDGK